MRANEDLCVPWIRDAVIEFGEVVLPEGSAERGALLRKERIYHSHLEDWRRQEATASLKPGGRKEKEKKGTGSGELARLQGENKRLRAQNSKLTRDLGRTKTALDIAGKAFALLEEISDSADSGEN